MLEDCNRSMPSCWKIPIKVNDRHDGLVILGTTRMHDHAWIGPSESVASLAWAFGMCAIWYIPNYIPLGTCKSVFLGRRVTKSRPGDTVPRLSNQMTRLNCRPCSLFLQFGWWLWKFWFGWVRLGLVWFGRGRKGWWFRAAKVEQSACRWGKREYATGEDVIDCNYSPIFFIQFDCLVDLLARVSLLWKKKVLLVLQDKEGRDQRWWLFSLSYVFSFVLSLELWTPV